MIYRINSSSSENTERLGEQIGAKLRGGELIELISDLGGGKTTFVRGLARGAGSSEPVNSPTFTLNNIYRAKNFDINHLDFYRLSEPGLMADELAEFVNDPKAVVVIEWGEIVADILPAKRLTVTIMATSENGRELEFIYPENLTYLIDK